MSIRWLVFSALVLMSTGCARNAEPHSSTSTREDGLRTYTVVREINGNPVTCGLPNVSPHVEGRLVADPASATEPVWLDDGGRRISVVWPAGFSVRFEPDAVLYNDLGAAVAREGERTELTMVSPDSAAGTFDDPYIASCWLFGEVYVYRP